MKSVCSRPGFSLVAADPGRGWIRPAGLKTDGEAFPVRPDVALAGRECGAESGGVRGSRFVGWGDPGRMKSHGRIPQDPACAHLL
ncbi:MAG TPA: hypothetical protein H9779_05005 [Candidatus Alistipes avicola]|uniref:Uncharacterized protein n=1 Tax=Candidatus Alistipes avicola TaxID=2838432 RepID=A0A9D2L458_9BACT|nr:hypothetical protein [Candidatus Alistipes avicola]